MKCQYRFKLNGKLTLSQSKPLNVRGLTYEFESDENRHVTHIKITRPLHDRREWPQYERSSEPGISYELKLNDPRLPLVQLEMRSLEAALSLFSVDSIDSDYPEIDWLPEHDAENNAVQVRKFQLTADNDFPPCPLSFDLIARTVIAAIDLLQVELPMSFFRHGRIAYGKRKYIEAIYQFYFMFETMFGNGKTGSKTIKNEFKKSTELRSAAEDSLRNAGDPFRSEDLANQVSEKFNGFNADRLIDYMVDLRGFLHHHTSKSKNMWHPSRQGVYNVDALMFGHVALKIFVGHLFKYVDDPKVVDQYRQTTNSQATR
jgi:hypothetical protein